MNQTEEQLLELTVTTPMSVARNMNATQRARKQSGLVKRNELCPCNSNVKFKKCCLPKINFPCWRKLIINE